MKKISGSLFKIVISCALMVSLVGCKGSSLGVKNVTPSQAFNEQGIWFKVFTENTPIGKDSRIMYILVFDGNGSVAEYDTEDTYYDENEYIIDGLTIGDLADMSDDEIISYAKEMERKKFDKELQECINDLKELDRNDLLPYAESISYQESISPYDLRIITDGTGNTTEKEELYYTVKSHKVKYKSIAFKQYGPYHVLWGEDPKDWEWYTNKLELDLLSGIEPIVVYDMELQGYLTKIDKGNDRYYLLKRINDGKKNFILDEQGAEGVYVD